VSARTILSRLRPTAKQAAERAGLGEAVERLMPVLGGRVARRDRRDNQAMRLALAIALGPDSDCVDVGASEGRVLEQLVRLAPRGRHIAYEPLPAMHAALQARFPDVDVRCRALSDDASKVEFTHVITRPGYSGFRERRYPGDERLQKIQVETETLDESLPEGFAPALVKIDVEGAEGEVLRGARRILERHRPVVLLEHGEAARVYGTTPAEVHGILVTDCGLRMFDMDGYGPYSLDAFEDVVARGAYWNFAAVL